MTLVDLSKRGLVLVCPLANEQVTANVPGDSDRAVDVERVKPALAEGRQVPHFTLGQVQLGGSELEVAALLTDGVEGRLHGERTWGEAERYFKVGVAIALYTKL